VFALVLLLRFVVRKEEHPNLPPTPFFFQEQPQQRQAQGPRFRRPSTLVRPPVSDVPNDLPRFQIQIASKDVETLRAYFWNGWGGRQRQERPEVLATVLEGGRIYTNVALHLKGAAGSFRSFDDKPALTLNFGKHAPGQRFHDYSKMSLNNSVQDPTYLCEAICRELFNAAGVPAPRAAWATVLINGRDLGLYVMIEGYNKDFLRHYFKNVKGNLYDGGFVQEINPGLAVNSGDHPEDKTDIQRLSAAASEADIARRWTRLNEVLDMDRFITLLAMDIILCNWDGYALNRNNYRLYHDLDTDRMVFMPHGMDQMFAYPPGRYSPEDSIQPMMKGLVARAVMSTPEGGRRYLARMDVLRTNLFIEEKLIGRVQEMAQHIHPTLAAYNPTVAQWHEAAVANLCDRIQRRIRSVTQQLAIPRETMAFDASGTAPVSPWNEVVKTQGADLQIDTVNEAGRTLLHFAALARGGTGSWRTRVRLAGGQYRFEGRARVSPNAVGSRLCLRISGMRVLPQTVTGTDWIPLSQTFFVEGLSEVILVCEFAGARGEAWFDVDSLRLVRE
jgi:spore coat protein H